MIRTASLITLFACFATSAFALSCAWPDAARIYDMARQDDASFYIVRGEIQLLEPARDIVPGQIGKTKARMTGTALSTSGFNASFDRNITIETSCLSLWCGNAAELTGTYITALRLDGETLTLSLGPCGGHHVAWDEAGEDRLLQCHAAQGCERVAN